jgi:hypothetical protein
MMHFLSLQNQCRRRNKHTYDAICFCDLCEATSGFVALIYTFHQLVAFQLCINHRILQHIELRWLRSVDLQHLPVLAFLVFPNNIKPGSRLVQSELLQRVSIGVQARVALHQGSGTRTWRIRHWLKLFFRLQTPDRSLSLSLSLSLFTDDSSPTQNTHNSSSPFLLPASRINQIS